jgi:ADP-glucose pyrophosphorylase
MGDKHLVAEGEKQATIKPADPKPSPNNPGKRLVSMGNYCFNREFLVRILKEDAEDRESRHDFGRDMIPKLIDKSRVYACNFIDENRKASQYWRDIGTIEAYYEANMDLVSVTPVFNLYDDRWPIHTYQSQYPPAKFVFAEDKRRGIALDSIVSMGSIISGGCVQNSVLSHAVRIESHAMVERSILFPHSTIGRNAHVRRAIIERKVCIPAGARIGFNLEEDRKKYHVTESGIVVVVPEDRAFERQASSGRAEALWILAQREPSCNVDTKTPQSAVTISVPFRPGAYGVARSACAFALATRRSSCPRAVGRHLQACRRRDCHSPDCPDQGVRVPAPVYP